MRPKEASTITNALSQFQAGELSPMIEIGSSTAEFRAVTKPHIENNLHKPLRERGIKLITTDLKTGDGIDINGSIYDKDFIARIRELKPCSLLCCNILEHVENPIAFSEICTTILNDSGILVISVPFNYPYHADPLDTLFRPNPDELANLFPGFITIFSAIVIDGSYYEDISRLKLLGALKKLSKDVFNILKLTSKGKFSIAKNHRFFWLFKKYKISILVLKKIDPVIDSA